MAVKTEEINRLLRPGLANLTNQYLTAASGGYNLAQLKQEGPSGIEIDEQNGGSFVSGGIRYFTTAIPSESYEVSLGYAITRTELRPGTADNDINVLRPSNSTVSPPYVEQPLQPVAEPESPTFARVLDLD